MKKRPIIDRMMDKVSPDPNTGCWYYLGGTHRSGYGSIRLPFPSRSQVSVHRLSYEHFVGPIPDGMCVCHKCDVRICVNPDHLFLGTHRDNMLDKVNKGRCNARHGSTHHYSTLDEETVAEILVSNEPQVSIAKRYNVSKATISNIKNRKIWKHVGALEEA